MSTHVDFFHCHIWFCKSQDCSIRVWDVAAASGVCNWPVARAAPWQMLHVALAKVEVGESCFSCGVWTAEPNSTVIFLEPLKQTGTPVTVNSTREPGKQENLLFKHLQWVIWVNLLDPGSSPGTIWFWRRESHGFGPKQDLKFVHLLVPKAHDLKTMLPQERPHG